MASRNGTTTDTFVEHMLALLDHGQYEAALDKRLAETKELIADTLSRLARYRATFDDAADRVMPHVDALHISEQCPNYECQIAFFLQNLKAQEKALVSIERQKAALTHG